MAVLKTSLSLLCVSCALELAVCIVAVTKRPPARSQQPLRNVHILERSILGRGRIGLLLLREGGLLSR